MAFEWTCPRCGGKEYSANPKRDKEKTRCICCGKEYENPYREKKKENGPPGNVGNLSTTGNFPAIFSGGGSF